MEYRRFIGRQWLGGTALLCLALGACNKNPQAAQQTAQQPATGAPIAALQLATAPPPPPTYAPPASALPPPRRPVAYRPSREHWRYLTDAYDMSDAFADTPPDYTVPYDGEDPYVWRADDGAYRVVEWLPEGARYYYYEPGADEPFLIQDPDYSYAYDDGALARVYTRTGAPVPDRIAIARESYAARYYARGHDLYRAAVTDRRRAAYAGHWQQRAPIIREQRTLWQRGREEEPGWRNWYQAHQPQQEARWAPERQRRASYAAALGAAGAAGSAYALHHRDQPPAGMDHRPGLFQNARPGQPRPDEAAIRTEQARRQAEQQAAQTRQRQLQQVQQTQRLEAQHQAQARRAEAQLRTQEAQQAQRHQLQQAQQAQRVEAQRQAQVQRAQTQTRLQQTQRAQRLEAQRAQAQARERQAQQAQRRALQQAQQTQRAEAKRQAQLRTQQAQQAQRAEAQRRAQAQQAQRRELQQAQQAQRAELQRQAQAQRAQARAEAHVASPPVQTARLQPPHTEAPRPDPAQHAQAARPPAPQPTTRPHRGGQKDDRHRH